LQPADQDALLLRFFAGKSLREVGQALGISDDAAQKRVHRALEKMRAYFASHGIAASTSAIAPAIAAHAVQAAPAGLAASLVAAPLAGAAGHAGVTAALNVFKVMALAQLKTSGVGALIATILLFAGTLVVVRMRSQANEAGAGVATTNPSSPAALILRGTVRTADGKPLAGALVRVATPPAYVRLYQTTNAVPATNTTVGLTNAARTAARQPTKAPTPAPSTNSAADGTFVIGLPEQPKDGLAAIVATSDAGYGLVTAEGLAADANV